MIDKENEVYTRCAEAVRAEFPDVDTTSLFVNEPSSFPHVSIIMRECSEWEDGIDSSGSEKISEMMFEVNVYSNRMDTPKSEAKKIMAIISDTMRSMNFVRAIMTPVDNLAKGTTSASSNSGSIYRLFARFEGKASRTLFMK